MNTTFPTTFTRPAVLGLREEQQVTTNVTIQFIKGCFMGSFKISAFDGEVEIWIHMTFGHYVNWTVTVMQCDSAIITIPGKEYDSESSIESAIDAITKTNENLDHVSAIGPWWDAALPMIKEKILGPFKGIGV